MFGSKILEIVVGLIFIFLIYSLLASSIQELLSSIYSSRARMLRKAIRRMLVDEHSNRTFWERSALDVRNCLVSLFPPFDRWWKLPFDFSSVFYRQPGIKYLGFSSKDKHPAYIKPETFAKTICDILKNNGEGSDDVAKISDTLAHRSALYYNKRVDIEPETHFYLETTWNAAEHDVERFKELLSQWFDETMNLLSLQYKKRMRTNLFCIGFLLAITFNINIIDIANKLSTDDKTREQLVSLSTSYLEAKMNDTSTDSTTTKNIQMRIDRLYSLMENEVYETNTFIAMGWNFPRNFELAKKMKHRRDSLKNSKTNKPEVSSSNKNVQTTNTLVNDSVKNKDTSKKANTIAKTELNYKEKRDRVLLRLYKTKLQDDRNFDASEPLTWFDKLRYVLYSAFNLRHILGYLITAVAVSFGAPFWFDLLSKVVKLKNNMKEEGKR